MQIDFQARSQQLQLANALLWPLAGGFLLFGDFAMAICLATGGIALGVGAVICGLLADRQQRRQERERQKQREAEQRSDDLRS